MKRLLLLFLFVFTALALHAQDTVYVYSSLSKSPDKKFASYYFLKNDPAVAHEEQIRFYDFKGRLHAEVEYNAAGEKEGLATFYYEEGGKEKELVYQKGRENGPFAEWYKNGQIKKEGEAVVSAKPEAVTAYLIYQYWDSLGTQLLQGGEGELALYYKDGTLKDKGFYKEGRKQGKWVGNSEFGKVYYEEEYQQGKFLRGNSSRDGVSYAYSVIDEEATPKDGMVAFYKFLFKKIDYPIEAVKAKQEGTTYIKFTIDTNGKVESAEAIEGRELGYGIDEEAIRVILLTEWIPGKHRGILTKHQRILPVKFSLTRKKSKG